MTHSHSREIDSFLEARCSGVATSNEMFALFLDFLEGFCYGGEGHVYISQPEGHPLRLGFENSTSHVHEKASSAT